MGHTLWLPRRIATDITVYRGTTKDCRGPTERQRADPHGGAAPPHAAATSEPRFARATHI